MESFRDALALHTPAHPIEAAALVTALAAWQRVGGPIAAGIAGLGVTGAFAQVGHPAIPAAIAGVGAAHAAAGRRIAGRQFLTQAAIVLAGFLLYEAARFQVVSTPEPAMANAARIVDLERALGLYPEPHLQRLLTAWGPAVEVFNVLYSHAFLAVVIGTLLWLVVADPPRYRLYRDALGISAALAIVLIAAHPVAPPRLMPGLGIEDTVAAAGNTHAFANEYAAIPSLHVGWTALAGWVLALPLRGWRRAVVPLGPGLGMLLIVIVTGNHYWIDGLIGAAVTVGPALALRHRAGLGALASELARGVRRLPSVALGEPRARFSASALGTLFIYLGLARIVAPGFTDFWGYLFFQVGVTLLALVLAEAVLRDEGGLSWLTHSIAVACTWADVLGTDGDLYARIDEYDKLTHAMGTAAVTAAAWEILRVIARRRGASLPPRERAFAAVATGVAAGIGWEVYEYLGDVVFHTARTQGRWDTFNDLVSDTAGAVAIASLLWWQERQGLLGSEARPGAEAPS